MNIIFFNELQKFCSEITNDNNNEEMISKVNKAFGIVNYFANLSRKEGLLALEEACELLDSEEPTQELFCKIISLVTDGIDNELIMEMGMNEIVSNNFSSYDGLIALMYYKAAFMISAHENPIIISEYMKSLMPSFLENRMNLETLDEILSDANKQLVIDKNDNLVERLCEDDCVINEKDHSITNQTALTILLLSDLEIQRILRELDNIEIELAMKVFPGKAKARIFDNLSKRLSNMLANDIMDMGPVRFRDIEETCLKILKIVIRLADNGEICSVEVCTLKILIDIYESNQEKNEEFKQRYRELKDVIDKIYNS